MTVFHRFLFKSSSLSKEAIRGLDGSLEPSSHSQRVPSNHTTQERLVRLLFELREARLMSRLSSLARSQMRNKTN